MPELERNLAASSSLASPARCSAHRVVLDFGGRAEVVTFDWLQAPVVSQVFAHGGQRWQIVQERRHARVWVAEPYAEQS
jgi:hypothetical protein